MIAWLFRLALGAATWLGGKAGDNAVAALKIQADRDAAHEQAVSGLVAAGMAAQRDVVVAGMAHRMFWVAWSLAALPLAAWFGWGVLDTLCNGALPDVAALPPQLKEYADTVWSNIFFTGAGVAGVTGAAAALGRAIGRKG